MSAGVKLTSLLPVKNIYIGQVLEMALLSSFINGRRGTKRRRMGFQIEPTFIFGKQAVYSLDKIQLYCIPTILVIGSSVHKSKR
jgi:hypothetical protein